MPGRAQTTGPRIMHLLLLAAAIWLGMVSTVLAGTEEERRVNVGIRIAPAVFAASENIDAIEPQTDLAVLVVYLDDAAYADEVARRLTQAGPLKGRELKVTTLSAQRLNGDHDPAPYAIFVAQQLGPELEPVIDYANRNDAISFSPFRGDVEAGILAGIAVSDRILPFINLDTLARLSHRFKPFFLKVAETYGR
ncbi:MAG: hypothetical protein ACQETD_09260 [Pseudomonadota bacterium]